MWTEDEIRARVAVSTAVLQKTGLEERDLAMIKEAGIDRVEVSITKTFGREVPGRFEQVLGACRNLELDVVSVHGPFDLPYQVDRDGAEEEVIEGSLASIAFAVEAGARHYVGHFGHGDRSRRLMEALIERSDGSDLVLTTENQTGQPLKPYDDFAREAGNARVGWTLDIGHARDDDRVNPFVKAEGASERIQSECAHVAHTHLHDSFDLAQKPDHRPPMHVDGMIRWVEVFEGLHAIGYEGDLVFEDGRGEDPEDWVRHAATFAERFMELYEAERL